MYIWKRILVVILILGVLAGIGGLIAWTQSDAYETKSLSNSAFKIGGLDVNGNYLDTNASIYTEDAFECAGLNVTMEFDSNVKYSIYFYDQNNDLYDVVRDKTVAFDKKNVPALAKYARIVVTPLNDDTVTTFEKNGYAKQLNITLNREQGYKNYTENLFVVDTVEGNNATLHTDGTVQESTGHVVSSYIQLDGMVESVVYKLDKGVNAQAGFCLCLYNADKEFVAYVDITTVTPVTTSLGANYFFLDLDNYDEPIYYIRGACSSIDQMQIILR